MGGFIIIPKEAAESTEHAEARCARSLEVFARKGLSWIAGSGGSAFLPTDTRSVFIPTMPMWSFRTAISYFRRAPLSTVVGWVRRRCGAFFADYEANKPIERECSGNFALVVCRKGELSLLADYCGYYPVYRSESAPMVSSSLLALAAAESNRRIDTQAMYEYLLHGFFVGEETLIEGIRRLDSRKLWQLSPVIAGASRMPAFDPLPVARGLDEVVETVSAELRHYFAMLSSLFPGDIGSALSGGYDSRHMTALLLSVGETPHLYVYGDSSSSDVRVAKNIALGERLELDHVDKSAFAKVTPEQFVTSTERDFNFFDGIKPLVRWTTVPT
ncbi:MAG: hypothetical protein IPG28_17920 [Betaproteobacteria bacterium]|nr:hypothetical protein [Betaproteobacteria bacterium]